MADYSSYKKINGDTFESGILSSAKFSSSPTSTYGVKWVYGTMCRCSPGCCCNWQVPTGVNKLWIQLWGAGGNGSGACSCNRCQHWKAAGGGYYNSQIVSTQAGCSYTACAAGVYPCLSRECYGCQGCSSYVNGYNLSNFCALGGGRGCSNTSWSTECTSDWACCASPTQWGGEMAMGNHYGVWNNASYDTYRGWCHCYNLGLTPTSAPLIGTMVQQGQRGCWIRCGCWIVPYGSGGQSAMTSYCGRCCGQAGTGGGGLVKITYF